MVSREHDSAGWVVEVRIRRFLYADGSTEAAPRYRAFQDLGLNNGEDDLQGQSDDKWAAFAERQRYWSQLSIMDLESAWQLARKHGYTNRRAAIGETVTVRASGARGIVTDDSGLYAQVRLAGAEASGTYPLSALILS
jgi:hypothetical protein